MLARSELDGGVLLSLWKNKWKLGVKAAELKRNRWKSSRGSVSERGSLHDIDYVLVHFHSASVSFSSRCRESKHVFKQLIFIFPWGSYNYFYHRAGIKYEVKDGEFSVLFVLVSCIVFIFLYPIIIYVTWGGREEDFKLSAQVESGR